MRIAKYRQVKLSCPFCPCDVTLVTSAYISVDGYLLQMHCTACHKDFLGREEESGDYVKIAATIEAINQEAEEFRLWKEEEAKRKEREAPQLKLDLFYGTNF